MRRGLLLTFLQWSFLAFWAVIGPIESKSLAQETQRIRPIQRIQDQWWIRQGTQAPSSKLSDAAENLVLGQTVHQVGDALEGLLYLITLQPRRAVDHLSNGLNPLGLVNSVVSDVAGCAKAPFCEPGFERPSIQVAIQNISQMRQPGEDHWAEIVTAPLNPGKHVGLHAEHLGRTFNWGGSLNFEKPAHFVAVRDSRDQSEFMALERLQCASSWLLNAISMDQDYFLLGYNCGGFVADVLEIAGMSSPFLANCGIGQELRVAGPAQSLKDELKKRCGERLDRVPEVLLKLEQGKTLDLAEKQFFESHVGSPQFHLQAVASTLRGRNLENLRSALDSKTSTPLEWIFGDDVHHVTLEVLSQKLSRLVRHTPFPADLLAPPKGWQPSPYARTTLEKVFQDLGPAELTVMQEGFPRVFEILEYYCGKVIEPGDHSGSICSRLP